MLTSECAGTKEQLIMPSVIAYTHTRSTRVARDSFTVLDNTAVQTVEKWGTVTQGWSRKGNLGLL